jgi:hypothetical protein
VKPIFLDFLFSLVFNKTSFMIFVGGPNYLGGSVTRIRCQTILALNAPAIRSVGVAIWPRLLLREAYPCWASGESKVRPLLEETLGRDVNPPGSAIFARGWARARRDRVP